MYTNPKIRVNRPFAGGADAYTGFGAQALLWRSRGSRVDIWALCARLALNSRPPNLYTFIAVITSNFVVDWLNNPTFWAGFSAWIFAQLAKLAASYVETRKIDPGFIFWLGGMPSSHSALVSAVTTSVGIRAGFDSALFAVAFGFAAIVMFDAQSVRRAAGEQARLLNQIVEEFFREHHFSQEKLVELLGHTRLEVIFGLILGVITAVLVHGLAKVV